MSDNYKPTLHNIPEERRPHRGSCLRPGLKYIVNLFIQRFLAA